MPKKKKEMTAQDRFLQPFVDRLDDAMLQIDAVSADINKAAKEWTKRRRDTLKKWDALINKKVAKRASQEDHQLCDLYKSICEKLRRLEEKADDASQRLAYEIPKRWDRKSFSEVGVSDLSVLEEDWFDFKELDELEKLYAECDALLATSRA